MTNGDIEYMMSRTNDWYPRGATPEMVSAMIEDGDIPKEAIPIDLAMEDHQYKPEFVYPSTLIR